jgi:hypothetical protein
MEWSEIKGLFTADANFRDFSFLESVALLAVRAVAACALHWLVNQELACNARKERLCIETVRERDFCHFDLSSWQRLK